MALENTSPERIEQLVQKQRAFYATGTTRDVAWRREQLKKFNKGLVKWEKALCDALWQDLHKSYEEAFMTELGLVYGEIGEAIRKVGKWARRQRKGTPLTVLPSSSYIVREPLGCTLIVSPWNYPVKLLLNPLVGAISAGCTAILKPSPYVPNVSKVIEGSPGQIPYSYGAGTGRQEPVHRGQGRQPADSRPPHCLGQMP